MTIRRKLQEIFSRSRTDIAAEDDQRAVANIDGVLRLKDLPERGRVVAAGVVVEKTISGAQGRSMSVRISDGTGVLQLIFFGHKDVSGVVIGVRLVVRGFVSNIEGMPTMQNPSYRIMGMAS